MALLMVAKALIRPCCPIVCAYEQYPLSFAARFGASLAPFFFARARRWVVQQGVRSQLLRAVVQIGTQRHQCGLHLSRCCRCWRAFTGANGGIGADRCVFRRSGRRVLCRVFTPGLAGAPLGQPCGDALCVFAKETGARRRLYKVGLLVPNFILIYENRFLYLQHLIL